MPTPAIELRAATLRRHDPVTHALNIVVDRVDWTVRPGEHWVILGPNGAGKTSMLRLAAAVERPYEGEVRVLGALLGSVDMRELRSRIGHVTARMTDDFHELATVRDVVLTGALGVTLLWNRELDQAIHDRASVLLARYGCRQIADRRYSICSQGERQRALLARALMNCPELLLLDEPTAGLDLPGRESFLAGMATLPTDEPGLASVAVVHHVEDIPACATHALLMRESRAVRQGMLGDALTSASLSETFGVALELVQTRGRYVAFVTA